MGANAWNPSTGTEMVDPVSLLAGQPSQSAARSRLREIRQEVTQEFLLWICYAQARAHRSTHTCAHKHTPHMCAHTQGAILCACSFHGHIRCQGQRSLN